MGFLDRIASAVNPIHSLLSGVQEIIGKFKLDPKIKTELELEFRRLEAKSLSEQREYELRLEKAYTKDAADLRRQARVELQSEDPFVRRARPAWVWGALIIYMTANALIPLISLFVTLWSGGVDKMSYEPVPLPYEVHMVVVGLVLGYGYMRGLDKSCSKPPFSR